MSIDVITDLQQAVEDAAAHLYVWSLKDIPQDLRDALADARDRETSVSGKRVLEIIHRNVEIAGGTHGRNRMMGNSLLECTVFGRRAGQAAAEKAKA